MTTQEIGRSRGLGAIITLATVTIPVAAALAHEGEGLDPHAAEASAPGYAALGLLALAFVSVAVWFQWRRKAMIRAARRSTQSGRNG